MTTAPLLSRLFLSFPFLCSWLALLLFPGRLRHATPLAFIERSKTRCIITRAIIPRGGDPSRFHCEATRAKTLNLEHARQLGLPYCCRQLAEIVIESQRQTNVGWVAMSGGTGGRRQAAGHARPGPALQSTYVLRRWCAGGVMPCTRRFLVAVTKTAAPDATAKVGGCERLRPSCAPTRASCARRRAPSAKLAGSHLTGRPRESVLHVSLPVCSSWAACLRRGTNRMAMRQRATSGQNVASGRRDTCARLLPATHRQRRGCRRRTRRAPQTSAARAWQRPPWYRGSGWWAAAQRTSLKSRARQRCRSALYALAGQQSGSGA